MAGLVLVVLILAAMGAYEGLDKELWPAIIGIILTVLIIGSIIILLGSCMELIGLI